MPRNLVKNTFETRLKTCMNKAFKYNYKIQFTNILEKKIVYIVVYAHSRTCGRLKQSSIFFNEIQIKQNIYVCFHHNQLCTLGKSFPNL